MSKEKPPFLKKRRKSGIYLRAGFCLYRFVVLQYRIASVILAQE